MIVPKYNCKGIYEIIWNTINRLDPHKIFINKINEICALTDIIGPVNGFISFEMIPRLIYVYGYYNNYLFSM